jgi:hypothetical protein
MSDDMRKILDAAELADFELIVRVLDSNLSFADDLGMRRVLAGYRRNPSPKNKRALAALLEQELRYAGSADVAYFLRRVAGRNPGVTLEQIVADVARELDVEIRMIGTLEDKLQRLTTAVVERRIVEWPTRSAAGCSGARQRAGAAKVASAQRHGPSPRSYPLTVVGREASESSPAWCSAERRDLRRDAARQLFERLAARFLVGRVDRSHRMDHERRLLTVDIQGQPAKDIR